MPPSMQIFSPVMNPAFSEQRNIFSPTMIIPLLEYINKIIIDDYKIYQYLIEKNFIACNFLKKKVIQDNERYVNNITEGFDFYLNVLDMYLNCSFFNDMKIKEISRFKEKILERQLYIKNKMK